MNALLLVGNFGAGWGLPLGHNRMPGKKADSSLLKSKVCPSCLLTASINLLKVIHVLVQSSDRSKRNDGGASGQQRPAYCISTTVSRGKWGTGNISGLHSEITPDRMTEDVRKLRSLYRYPKELNNAFSRVRLCLHPML